MKKNKLGYWMLIGVSLIGFGIILSGCNPADIAGPSPTTTAALAATTTTVPAATTTTAAATTTTDLVTTTTTTTTTTSTTTTTLMVPTGMADSDFSGSGWVTADSIAKVSPEVGARDWAWALAVDSNGKILLAGQSDGPKNSDAFVCRYSSDGTLDWKAVYDSGGGDQNAAVTSDSAGNVFTAGYIAGPAADIAVIKYTTSGILDPSFGHNGVASFEDSSGGEYASGIALDNSGNIYIAGEDDKSDMRLLKFNSSGQSVAGFGASGVVKYDGGGYDSGSSIVIDGSGKILVGGTSNNGTTDMIVWRYDPANGVLDSTFGTGGKAIYHSGANEYGQSVTLDEAGKILLLGDTLTNNFVLCRFTDSGTLDATFGGGDGVVIYGSGEVFGSSIASASSGKILVAGYKGPSMHWKATLWRFNSDGTLDTTFNSGQGYISSTLTAGDQDERGQAVVTDSLGRYLMGGYTKGLTTSADAAIWRFK